MPLLYSPFVVDQRLQDSSSDGFRNAGFEILASWRLPGFTLLFLYVAVVSPAFNCMPLNNYLT